MLHISVNIVNYEEQFGINGILSKYAYSLERELRAMGHEGVVTAWPQDGSNVTHHINYLAYRGPKPGINTLMITHLTGDRNQGLEQKMDFLREALETAYGITMSPVLRDQLIKDGLPAERLFYVYHAHDLPRPPRVIAILHNIYPDGRKQEWMYEKLFQSIDKAKFQFNIMGTGWNDLLSRADIFFNHFPKFEIEDYVEILNTAHYVLYTGDEDCVAQSLIDAKQAGIRTIFPDIPANREFGIDHPFTTILDLIYIFKKLEENPVEGLTWRRYAEEHLKIWKELCSR